MTERLFSYYGDDFTGSTDALEALAANAVPTVLFLDPPDERRLAGFGGCHAIGIAGESRSRGPEWMSRHLPSIFGSLKSFGAPICQYKVCSTFDSSPEFGSIGRALEIGREVFECPWVPVVVAAPHLRRYVLFGNLFAWGDGAVHRIDRHPTMRRHPVTPMDESDLRLHLGRQTNLPTGLLDITALHGDSTSAKLEELVLHGAAAVIFDGLDEASLRETGSLLWMHRGASQPFAVGSSGLTHALIRQWRADGTIPPTPTPGQLEPAGRLIVISGSCSPVTASQIRWAASYGFAEFRIDPSAPQADREHALAALAAGRSVVLYTALGPEDRAESGGGEELGRCLGLLLHDLMLRSGVRRAVVAGGDTSSHAVRQLGLHALTFAAQLAPGAPLCRAHSTDPAVDGIELVLKGGQTGPENFFGMVLEGRR